MSQYQPERYDSAQHTQRVRQQHPQQAYPPYGLYQPPPPPSERTYRTAARRQKSTFVHGVLTFCTGGLWSPVWIMACAENARIRKAQAQVAQYQAMFRA